MVDNDGADLYEEDFHGSVEAGNSIYVDSGVKIDRRGASGCKDHFYFILCIKNPLLSHTYIQI